MSTDAEPNRVVIPVVEERIEIEKRSRRTGTVQARRRVREEEVAIDEPLERVEVEVVRVPVGRWIDAPLAMRQEGETTIIPVIEEVVVVEKRLRLVEEVHVTRRRRTHRHQDRVTVRRTEVEVAREPGEAPPPAIPSERRRHPMTTTVIGLYKEPDPARRAREALAGSGCDEAGIRLFDHHQEDMASQLAEFGIDEEDAGAFAGAVAKGAAVIAVEVEDDRADAVRALLERNGAHAVDAYADEGEDEGEDEAPDRGGETGTLPEAEERLEIGKRRVVRGGVRARTRVTERPVEKKVGLEEETVRVRHRDADRDLSPEETEAAFRESSVELTETAEEAEVRKAARLIGEVELSKSSRERQETVRDTVRKTEVDVERMDAGKGGGSDRGRRKR